MKKAIVSLLSLSIVAGLFAGGAQPVLAAELPEIAPGVIYEDDNFVITQNGFTTDDYDDICLSVTIENKSEEDVTISPYVSVNDYAMVYACLNDSFSGAELAAGETLDSTLVVYDVFLEPVEIDTIGTVELQFTIEDGDYDVLVSTDPITLTVDENYTQEVDDSGELLCDKDGIRIINKGLVEDKLGDTAIQLLIENNSDKPFAMIVDDFTLNGEEIDDDNYIFYVLVYPGDRIIDTVAVVDIEATEAGSWDAVESAVISFDAFNPDTYKDIAIFEELELGF